MKLNSKRPVASDDEKQISKRMKLSTDDYVAVQKVLQERPSLFHMQVEELLHTVRLKRARWRRLEERVEELKDVLLNMSPGKERKIQARKWLQDIKLPLQEPASIPRGVFQFGPPTRVYLGGSVPLNTCIQPASPADLILEMPKDCLQVKDCLNHRYVSKRAQYLCVVARRLSKMKLVESIQFTYHVGNPYKPILVVTLTAAGKGKPLVLNLHVIPEEGLFKPSRFHISKNNVRPRWFFQLDDQEEGEEEKDTASAPTPVYNSSILQDICHAANAEFLASHLQGAPALQDGVALLKVWMARRQLHVGYGGFSGFLMSMYVCHLLDAGVILPTMTSFQVFRTTVTQLSKSEWLDRPVSLCPESGKGHPRPDVNQFRRQFDVVFVDVTGYLNLALGMTKALYKRVVHEASVTAGSIISESPEHFSHLFATSLPFRLKFDSNITVKLSVDTLRRAVERQELSSAELDLNGHLVAVVTPALLTLLERGLTDRVKLVQAQPVEVPQWEITVPPPPAVEDCTVTFGLLLHPTHCLRHCDKGPQATSAQAEAFRAFWGAKSELRRFKDDGILEAVVWGVPGSESQKRQICQRVVSYLLNFHAGIDAEAVHSEGQQAIESLLHIPRRLLTETLDSAPAPSAGKKKGDVRAYGTGEERIYSIRRVLEDLSKTLRGLKTLPLMMNNVTGIDPVFRFAEVFPAHPIVEKLTSEALLRSEEKCPLPVYTPAMTVICSLEGSGKWPEDIDRIRDLKTLYLIDLGDKLSDIGLEVSVQESYLDVLKEGFVFRLKLGISREIGVLRRVQTPTGMVQMDDTPEALAVEHEITTLPEFTIRQQGVQQNHLAFCSAVRLVKRWLSAQLLLDHVGEGVAERVTAAVFDKPRPFSTPGSPLVAFLRFLHFVIDDDFKVENFCDKVTPPPPPVILNWLRTVATQSLRVILNSPDSQWKVMFKPPLEVYDAVVHLSAACQCRRHQGVGVKEFPALSYPDPPSTAQDPEFPVVNFDPVRMFLQQLQAAYKHEALFFHDRYGGTAIGVLLKPGVKEPAKFAVDKMFGRKPTVVNDKPALTFDLEAMVEGISVLGGDMVTRVDVKQK